ncbi:MAG: ABC transporter ATP-binding protein [Pseudooceanicola nanhaiensis]
MTRSDPRLSARAVRIGYGGAPVVAGLDLDIPAGRFTALLGPNGCGKSTILRAFSRLLPIESGRILLDGRDISALGTKALARKVGLLSQGAVAPEGLTVLDLVRQGRYPHRSLFGNWSAEDEEAVEAALQVTETTGMRNAPLDTLSGGQRQRAWIAMVLAQRAGILLLDEPTTYLDMAHQIEVLGLMRRLVDEEGITVVAVLHDLNQAAHYADMLVMLRSGELRAQGTPESVLSPATVADIFGVEVSILPDPETGRPLCIPRRLSPGQPG